MTSVPPVREQAQLFGPQRALVGIITQGPTPAAAPPRPVVVILNSGIVHRVGANRMSVALARRLASGGATVVRFDLSGIGDSDPRSAAMTPLETALADIKDVLDALEASRGARRFILVGLCSGADLALAYASGTDRRVVGAVLLDPSVPRTRRHYVLHYRRRALRLESWINLARGRSPLWLRVKQHVKRALVPAPGAEPPGARGEMSLEARTFLDRAYRRALANEVRMLAVLTGERSYYREQLLEAFPGVPFDDQLRLEYFAAADHTFTAHAERAHLMDLIVAWTERASFRDG